jgi:rubredoxin
LIALDKYQCQVCGYIYEPENGDPDHGIAPGTPFESLPYGWVCPVCGAARDMFGKMGAGDIGFVQGFML